MNNNDGRYLEDIVKEWFTDRAMADVMLTRLPDSRSARNLIQAQNADFLMGVKGYGACHIECKSIGGLKQNLRMFRQYHLMNKWNLAGVPGFVLIHFYDLKTIAIVEITSAPRFDGKKYWPIQGDPYTTVIGSDRKEDFFTLLDTHVQVLKGRRLR